jgi:hypothetical protein
VTVSAVRTGPERPDSAPYGALLRFGGGCLIVAAFLTAGSGIAHPRSGDKGYPLPFLESVLDNRLFWATDHVVMFFGSLIGIAGLFVLASYLTTGLASRIARGGFAVALIGQAVLAGFVAVDGVATPRVAQVWDQAHGAARESAFAAARAVVEIGWAFNGLFFITLFGIGFGLYGIALGLDGRYGRLGGAVVPVTIASVIVGIIELLTGARLGLVYFQNALMILTLVWVAYIGVRLWRDGSQ